ncbi:hypothetical protein M0805_004340, partial [Coniferiporia weirii]
GLAFATLNEFSLRQEALYQPIVEVLGLLGAFLGRETALKFKADYLVILTKLLEQGVSHDELGTDWHQLLQQFVSQVGAIIGQELHVKSTIEAIDAGLNDQEVKGLRRQVEDLGKERTELQNELNLQRVEIDTLKSLQISLSPSTNSSRTGKEGIQGLVQRLVLKEKQVVQLQAEVNRLKLSNPLEARDTEERLKHERDRVKWNGLMEEIADLKTK